MKLNGYLVLLGVAIATLFCVIISADSTWPRRTNRMVARQKDERVKATRNEEKQSIYSGQIIEENIKPMKEKKEQEKIGKMEKTKYKNSQNYEENTEEIYNMKVNKQNKEQIKYVNKRNIKETSKEKKTNNINYKTSGSEDKTKSKINAKEENKLQDGYVSVPEKKKEIKSRTAKKIQGNEEKPLDTLKVKTVKSSFTDEDKTKSSECYTAQKSTNKVIKQAHHGSCDDVLEEKSKSEKLPRKQYKHVLGKMVSKQEDENENNMEEDNIKLKTKSRKQYNIRYEDRKSNVFDEDIVKQNKKQSKKQKNIREQSLGDDKHFEKFSENKIKHPKEKYVKDVTMKYDANLNEEHVQLYDENLDFLGEFSEKIHCTQIKYYQPISEDNKEEEEDEKKRKILKVDDFVSLNEESSVEYYDEMEIVVDEKNVDNDGRINILKKQRKHESKIEIEEGPEAKITDQYKEIENTETLKDSKLILLKKYMLVEVTDSEDIENIEESSPFNLPTSKGEETSEKQDTNEELNPDQKMYMYIVEEVVNGHQIRYTVEEDNGEPSCSLPETKVREEEEITL